MRKRDYRKIMKYIDSLNIGESITPEILSKQINIEIKEIESVFVWLIQNDKVIDLSSKLGMQIANKRGVDYSSIHNKITHKMSIKTKITLTISILTFIVFVVINWDKICELFY